MDKDFVQFDRETLKITVHLPQGDLIITKDDVEVSHYSGGAGGQNVNRHMNGVRLIYQLPLEHIRNYSKTRELITRSMNQRSQEQNQRQAFEQLAERVRQYFYIKPRRKKSRVPGWAKKKRLENKKRKSQKKQSRKSGDFDI